MNVEQITVIPNPEKFGQDWYSRPDWLTKAYTERAGGPVHAVSVKQAIHDAAGIWQRPQRQTTYAVTTSDGKHWCMSTSGWQQVSEPAF